ncbi:MAG: MBL fold metallo-hydrolase, partial [Pseudomonadales bacterium]|nr:MBL fold metallo-hydrolase [Pseudomonadales bacterium]
MTTDIKEKAKSILTGSEGFSQVSDGIYILPAQGNALAVIGDDGVLLLDSGPGGSVTNKMIASLRTVTDLPVRYICYSHGHLGYNDGVAEWLEHNESRGEARPVLVAHSNCVRRYRRYRETLGLQRTLGRMQFPGMNIRFALAEPDLVFEQRITVPLQGRQVELIWVPSETDDTIALWMPEEKLLYAGAAFPGTTIANIGTPLRTQRFTIRWAESCELMASLNAETFVQEFGPVITDPAEITERLTVTASTLRWFRNEVVRRMNLGMNEHEILADMTYPETIDKLEYMKARYGAPEYIVRDLYREENGWWDRNPTSL